MTTSRPTSTMTTRQKVIIVSFVIVLIFLAWQVYGLFGGGGGGTVATAPSTTSPTSAVPPTGPAISPNVPQPASLSKPAAPLTPQEAELLRQQKELEAKYLAAVNELQMLRIEREIAETNKAIMAAKFDTISSEKHIVDLLKPQPLVTPGSYAAGLETPVAPQPTTPVPQPTTPTIESYQVISVTQINYKWTAVLGYQGNLYSVQVGDVLPADQSKVISIDKTGVVLLKDSTRKKLSLVPII